MKYLLLFLVITACLVASAQPAQQWELTKDKNGIKVYTSPSATTKFKTVRVVCVLEGTIQRLTAILLNVSAHTDWVYKTKISYIVKQVSPTELVYYSQTSMPWPVKNRDGVYRLLLRHDTTNHTLYVNGKCEPKLLPEKEGVVRIHSLKTNWVVKEAANRLTIEYIIELDPAGTLPAWMTNMFADKGPYESFIKLAALLKS